MEKFTLATQTMFAELQQRSLDAEFDETFDERGVFVRKRVKGRQYWYFQRKIDSKAHRLYVGPTDDAAITDRIERFGKLKSDFKQRREMVRALLSVGLPAPDPITGSTIEAMWKAGFFRLRGLLVGTIAFQCYSGILGVRLGGASLRTQDVDFAQFWGISQNLDDRMLHPLLVLQNVDPTFTTIPDLGDPFVTWRYRNKDGFMVEFLTPNRGSDDHQGHPARMKSLDGAGAQPLRHLEFLIHQPERSVLLYKGGVPVSIPRAERYAVHKLIVAVERRDQAKSAKDIMQASVLIDVLSKIRPMELVEAWQEAFVVGPQWQKKLLAGRERLSPEVRRLIGSPR